MRPDHILRQEVQITGFSGHICQGSTDERRTRTKNQRVVRGGERTVRATPGRQERRMEGRQDPWVKRKRPREHSNGGTPKYDENHNDVKEDQQRGKRQTSSALTEESIHLKIHIDHRKATKKGGTESRKSGRQVPAYRTRKRKNPEGKVSSPPRPACGREMPHTIPGRELGH